MRAKNSEYKAPELIRHGSVEAVTQDGDGDKFGTVDDACDFGDLDGQKGNADCLS